MAAEPTGGRLATQPAPAGHARRPDGRACWRTGGAVVRARARCSRGCEPPRIASSDAFASARGRALVMSWWSTSRHRRPKQLPRGPRGPTSCLIDLEDRAEVQRVTGSVLAKLSERQREIVSLHGHGRKRPEIAEHLGMTPRSVKRALERIMAVGRDELVRLAGHGCESGETLVARFAFWLAGPGEARRAQLHLATCPRCGAMYERLDCWRENVAAVLPVPVLQHRHGGIERALHGFGDALSGLWEYASQRGGALRQHAADRAAQVKEHVGGAYYRAVDPTPLAGVRPGAAAAAVAGCLAIGGGAGCRISSRVGDVCWCGGVLNRERPGRRRVVVARPEAQ